MTSEQIRILAATSKEVRLALKRGADRPWARLKIALNGSDYAVVAPEPVLNGHSQDLEAEITIPLPKMAKLERLDIVEAETGVRAAASGLRPLPTTRKGRALVIYPAGEIYEHDKVRWYKAPMDKLLADYFNIGDMIVFDSTLKLLDFEHVEPMKIMNPTDQDIERYASDFDYVFVRGSNFIHEKMAWFRAVEVLEKVKLPVYAIGVGAQASSKRLIELPKESKDFWHTVADRCGSIGVRGAFSAETLNANGVKNVEIVGCPSFFRARNRDLKIAVKDQRAIHDVAFSLRREVDHTYTTDPTAYLARQRQAMLAVDEQSNMIMTSHGEQEEKAFFYKDRQATERAVKSFVQSGWWRGEDDAAMSDIYRNRSFFFTDVIDYDAFIRTKDLAIGYRVHGVLPAIAQGVPGFLVSYDQRSHELAETLSIPLVKEEALAEGGWRAVYDVKALEKLAASFPKSYDRMKSFMDRNGMPNRM